MNLPHREHLSDDVRSIYGWAVQQLLSDLFSSEVSQDSSPLLRLSDYFQDEKELRNFVAATLIHSFYKFTDESKKSITGRINSYADHFASDPSIDRTTMRKFINSKSPLCYVGKFSGRPVWWQFGTVF
jgi:hypothetical protein